MQNGRKPQRDHAAVKVSIALLAVIASFLTAYVVARARPGFAAVAPPSAAPPAAPAFAPPPALPAFGAYNSREPGGDLTGLEAQDLAMSQTGLTFEVNYIGLHCNLTGANSCASWLAYDAALTPVMHQFINVKDALADSDALTGTSLVNDGNIDGNLGSACPASDNQQLILCVYDKFHGSPAFGGWYVYDEPGCPNQSIGYCAGSMARKNYDNVRELAAYIASIDSTHPIIGIQTASGIPPGGWSASNPAAAAQIGNLYSWLTNQTTPNTGMDYYPFPAAFNSPPQYPKDLAVIERLIANVLAAGNPAETNSFVGQAFSWYQEDQSDCRTISACPYPTQAQMQALRDNALYYANAYGYPIKYFLWYYWPDVVCINSSAGCFAAANQAQMQAVDTAPFPAAAPL
jgi:hypothetical protein